MSNHKKVIVIGSGPAGLTAALYTGRANLSPLIFEGHQPGGQLMITTEVENYPGYEHGIQGPDMMDIFRKQAHRFGAESKYELITEIDFSKKPFTIKSERGDTFTSDSIIVSTGATAKLLGLEGEMKFMGYGVSACATCDGFFFKNQEVIVVGGGDTAMEEANYLTRFCSKVVLIHRRDEFRASRIMIDRAKNNPKIEILMNTTISEIIGDTDPVKKVTSVVLKNTINGEEVNKSINGVFIAIGHKPNTELFKGVLDMDENGYLITKGKSSYTNIDGVFACGDCQDHIYRQAITAAGSGCMAAIDSERWLENN
jgi:thioredoxin reductase (NADPH)